MTDTVGKISFAPVQHVAHRGSDPLSDPNSFKGGHLSQTSLELLDIVERQTKALRKFVAWFDLYERTWGDEYRGGDEFLDLRDAYDAAKAVLK